MTSTASMRKPRTRLARPRTPIAERMMLWLSRGKRIGRLWIGTYFQANAETVMGRLEAAIDLIRRNDPIRYARIERDLDRIWVKLLPGALGHFDASLRACCLDERFVFADTTTPQHIASVIVHEATHARLWSSGIAYDEEIRERVERICLRREQAFSRRLADGAPLSAWVGQSAMLPADTWSDASLSTNDLEGNAQTLKHLGYPDWLIRTILAVRRWRMRRSPSQ